MNITIIDTIRKNQPEAEIVQQSDTKITLRGKFISETGTDDIEYFTPLRLISASFSEEQESRTYILPKR